MHKDTFHNIAPYLLGSVLALGVYITLTFSVHFTFLSDDFNLLAASYRPDFFRQNVLPYLGRFPISAMLEWAMFKFHVFEHSWAMIYFFLQRTHWALR